MRGDGDPSNSESNLHCKCERYLNLRKIKYWQNPQGIFLCFEFVGSIFINFILGKNNMAEVRFSLRLETFTDNLIDGRSLTKLCVKIKS
jgi:hypothetical protein